TGRSRGLDRALPRDVRAKLSAPRCLARRAPGGTRQAQEAKEVARGCRRLGSLHRRPGEQRADAGVLLAQSSSEWFRRRWVTEQRLAPNRPLEVPTPNPDRASSSL